MATGLQVKNNLRIISGGYVGEDTGGVGTYDNWTDANLSGSATAEYWYSDSDYGQNANSIKIFVSITDSWNATINYDNSITVTYQTTINKIEKRNKYGNPGTTPRTIRIYAYDGGPLIYNFDSTPMSLYVVAENLQTISGTLVLPPSSDSGGMNTLYYKNGYPNHMDDPLPSIYVDAMGMGLAFRNLLPPDFRPGSVWNGSTWKSHNRASGAANIFNGSNYATMRTINGGTAQGNPPLIRHASDWYNMRRIGDES